MEQRLAQVRGRIERAYLDKVDGKIREEFWEARTADWNREEQQILMAMQGMQQYSPERILNGVRILELANKAYFLYLKQSPAEKAKLLRIVLSNCKVDAASVYPTYRKPFDLIFQRAKNEEWRAEEDGVEAIYLSSLGHYRALTLNPRVVGFCRVSLRQFDLVHFFGLYDLLGPAVSYFCRRRGIPYLVEPMGMYRPIVRSLRLKRLYHRLFGDQLIRGACFLIATSEQEKQELMESGVAGTRIVIRPNGVELPEKSPTPGDFRRRWGVPHGAKMILFLGRLVSKKSPDLLLEAFARWRARAGDNRNAVLVLAGPEEGDGFQARLEAMKEKAHLKEQVLFTGPLYDDAKWSAYRDADLFVLPSQNENFGNTAAEAAACGTPVIVTDRCGIAPFVGGAGMVIQHDVGQLCDALEGFLALDDSRARYEKGCKELVEKLSWEGPLDLTEDLYRRCPLEESRE